MSDGRWHKEKVYLKVAPSHVCPVHKYAEKTNWHDPDTHTHTHTYTHTHTLTHTHTHTYI